MMNHFYQSSSLPSPSLSHLSVRGLVKDKRKKQCGLGIGVVLKSNKRDPVSDLVSQSQNKQTNKKRKKRKFEFDQRKHQVLKTLLP
jgi:hypothetical protein